MKRTFIGLDGKEYSFRFKHIIDTGSPESTHAFNLITDALYEAVKLGQAKLYNGRQRSIPNIRGVTLCTIERQEPDGKWINVYKGFAFCSSKDQFSRKRGRQIAMGRVLGQLHPYQQTNLLSQISI